MSALKYHPNGWFFFAACPVGFESTQHGMLRRDGETITRQLAGGSLRSARDLGAHAGRRRLSHSG